VLFAELFEKRVIKGSEGKNEKDTQPFILNI